MFILCYIEIYKTSGLEQEALKPLIKSRQQTSDVNMQKILNFIREQKSKKHNSLVGIVRYFLYIGFLSIWFL